MSRSAPKNRRVSSYAERLERALIKDRRAHDATEQERQRLNTLVTSLEAQLAELRDEITHHEARAAQQQTYLEGLRHPPAAWSKAHGKAVPLQWWTNQDLLELLHDLERRAMSVHLQIGEDGRSVYPRVGFTALYATVVDHARSRGLVGVSR